MSYVRRSSGPDEVVIHRARFPFVYHLVSWLYLLVFGILVVGIVVFLQREVRAWSTEMAVTSRRVVLKEGLFTIDTEELPLATVEEINLHQSLWGRIFGYGTIAVSGTGAGGIQFPAAQSPLKLRNAIEQAVRQAHAA